MLNDHAPRPCHVIGKNPPPCPARRRSPRCKGASDQRTAPRAPGARAIRRLRLGPDFAVTIDLRFQIAKQRHIAIELEVGLDPIVLAASDRTASRIDL